MRTILLFAIASAAAWPQETRVNVVTSGDPLLAQAVEVQFSGQKFEYMTTVMQYENKVVKGAPYSADAVTETVQVLPDGNRITRKNSSAVYRDSQGRTRRETTIEAIGPWPAEGNPPQTITISDPVSGVTYLLNSRTKEARKVTVFSKAVPGPGALRGVIGGKIGSSSGEVRTLEVTAEASPGEAMVVHSTEGAAVKKGTREGERKTESLGRRNIEGVDADGTRTTMTIAAGEIGNELPIEIVSDRWYSPELQTVVLSERNDPRFGKTTYRLTRINRSEPPASLFQLPPDYTIKEGADVKLRTSGETK